MGPYSTCQMAMGCQVVGDGGDGGTDFTKWSSPSTTEEEEEEQEEVITLVIDVAATSTSSGARFFAFQRP